MLFSNNGRIRRKTCVDGNIEEVQHLLTNNPDLNLNCGDSSEWKKTPFYIVCQEGYLNIVELLLSDERVDVNKPENLVNATSFGIACFYGHIEVVKLLLSDGRVDLNATTKYDETAFYIACEKGQIEIVKLLLNNEKVDITSTNNPGPFYLACREGHFGIVKLLLNDERVDVNEGNEPYDHTAFYCLSTRAL